MLAGAHRTAGAPAHVPYHPSPRPVLAPVGPAPATWFDRLDVRLLPWTWRWHPVRVQVDGRERVLWPHHPLGVFVWWAWCIRLAVRSARTGRMVLAGGRLVRPPDPLGYTRAGRPIWPIAGGMPFRGGGGGGGGTGSQTPDIPDVVVVWNNTTGQAVALDNRVGTAGTILYSGSDLADVYNQAAATLTAYGLPALHPFPATYYAFPPAPTITVGGAGSVNAGDHEYAWTFLSAGGESVLGLYTAVTLGVASQVTVSAPIGPTGTTSRKLYRTLATGPALTDGEEATFDNWFLVGTIADNSTASFLDNVTDASINGAGNSGDNFFPSINDGGSIAITRAAGSFGGTKGAVPITKPLQVYSLQMVYGLGRTTRIEASGMRSAVGSLQANITTTTQTTISITESAFPAGLQAPFVAMIDNELFEIVSRTAGAPATWNAVSTSTAARGTLGLGWLGTTAVTHTAGAAVYLCLGGRARLGAMLDVHGSDRAVVQDLQVDGNANAFYGLVHRRNTKANAATPSGPQSTGYFVRNYFTGQQAGGMSIGNSNDSAATANAYTLWSLFGSTGSGPGWCTFIGDCWFLSNNVKTGNPGLVVGAGNTFVQDTHVGVSAGVDIFHRQGQNVQVVDSYMDKITSSGGIVRPTGGSSAGGQGMTIDNVYFNGGTMGTGAWVSADNPRGWTMTNCHGALSGTGFMANCTGTVDGFVMNGCYADSAGGGTAGGLWNTGNVRPTRVINCRVTNTVISTASGVGTFNGTGAQTAFNITHGMGLTPTVRIVTPGSTDAKGDAFVTVSSTQITVTFGTAPPNGTNNVVLAWYAEA